MWNCLLITWFIDEGEKHRDETCMSELIHKTVSNTCEGFNSHLPAGFYTTPDDVNQKA